MASNVLANLPDQSLMSQTFTVPVYERVPNQDGTLGGASALLPDFPNDAFYTQVVTPSSGPSRLGTQVSCSIPSTTSQKTPVSSNSDNSNNEHIDQPQLRRAYERLQSRYSLVEAENQQIRDINRQNREELRRVVLLLEDILVDSTVCLRPGTYDKLERASDIVTGVERKLS